MGSIPKTKQTENDVLAAGFSIKKEERRWLSTSDKLKLSNDAREGDDNKFTFFQSNIKILNDFETIYNLHMRIDSLTKSLEYYGMKDVLKIVLEQTVQCLNTYLETMFVYQASKADALDAVARDSSITILLLNIMSLIHPTFPL